jgi:hypothetical protein
MKARYGMLIIALAAAASLTSVATAVPAPTTQPSSGTTPAHSSAISPALTPALSHAQEIRAEVTARYRPLPGRRLVVTAATSTGGASTLALVTSDGLEGRIVPTDNGIHFDTCSLRAICPYPARWAAWRVAAFMPRRQALELALRTFMETTASLVVVALPTAQPVWAVFERDDLLAHVDAPDLLDRLASSPAVDDRPVRKLVGELTRPRLVAPAALGADDSILVVRLFGS